MLLGTMIKELQDERSAVAALLALGDVLLLADVEAVRSQYDETVGEYVTGAAQRFARLADDEDWLALMTALERADQPAPVCLSHMVRWSIARDTAPENHRSGRPCDCGSAAGGCHEET